MVGFARQEPGRRGVLLDPCTVRTSAGLAETLSRAARAFGQRVCFIHTGGPFSVFPLRERPSRAPTPAPAAGGETAAERSIGQVGKPGEAPADQSE